MENYRWLWSSSARLHNDLHSEPLIWVLADYRALCSSVEKLYLENGFADVSVHVAPCK